MKRAMLSQPMRGRTDDEILAEKEKAVAILEEKGYEVINSFFPDEYRNPESMKERGVINVPIAMLAKSIEVMSQCNALMLCDGWEEARGCRIENEIAAEYGLDFFDANGNTLITEEC